MFTLSTMNFLTKYISLSFHLSLSFSLLFIGEYTTTLVLQFGFLTLFVKLKNFIYIFYIPLVLFALMKLFASTYYPFYFFNLSFLLYALYKNNFFLTMLELLIWHFYLLFLYLLYNYFEEEIYDIYILIDIEDKVHYIDLSVSLILTALHFIIFIFLFKR